ncbi:hypothetical protein MSPP1_002409 [Malassezia sp. CBS 17886]|nr:hypothetical protein MSPP1_002409 [Malassezia sp. CBS 17886]
MDRTVLEDAFELLDVQQDATEQQVRTAFRRRSLLLHPDKAKDVAPEVAAERFHRLTVAYEQLLDPATRTALAAQLQQDRERRARHSAFDDRRRQMAADLEAREALDKTQRAARAENELRRAQRVLALREEGRRMRAQKHDALLSAWHARRAAHMSSLPQKRRRDSDAPMPPSSPLDTRVLIRFPTDQCTHMLGVPEGAALDPAAPSPLRAALTAAYGPVSALFSRPRTSQKRRRETTVIASFADLPTAWSAVEDGRELRCTDPLLQDCWMGWGDEHGKERADEPLRVQHWRRSGLSPSTVAAENAAADAPPVAPTAIDADYEADTLQRLRQAAGDTAMHVDAAA